MAHHSNRGASVGNWRTPAKILLPVRAVFGGKIALDPASASDNPTDAEVFFTHNGLEQSWEGHRNIFCNPPWRKAGMPVVWWMAPLWHFAIDHPLVDIITVCPASTNATWFQDFVAPAACHCLPRGRIAYDAPPGFVNGNAPSFDTCISYWGPNPKAFATAFGHLGKIAVMR